MAISCLTTHSVFPRIKQKTLAYILDRIGQISGFSLKHLLERERSLIEHEIKNILVQFDLFNFPLHIGAQFVCNILYSKVCE